jgi:hypothetical protein
MFTLPFWIIFALGILLSLGISIVYGRRAIHPRLRPHFGQVVVVFLVMVLVAFFIAVVLGKLAGGGMEAFDPDKIRERQEDSRRPPSRPVERNPDQGP